MMISDRIDLPRDSCAPNFRVTALVSPIANGVPRCVPISSQLATKQTRLSDVMPSASCAFVSPQGRRRTF